VKNIRYALDDLVAELFKHLATSGNEDVDSSFGDNWVKLAKEWKKINEELLDDDVPIQMHHITLHHTKLVKNEVSLAEINLDFEFSPHYVLMDTQGNFYETQRVISKLDDLPGMDTSDERLLIQIPADVDSMALSLYMFDFQDPKECDSQLKYLNIQHGRSSVCDDMPTQYLKNEVDN